MFRKTTAFSIIGIFGIFLGLFFHILSGDREIRQELTEEASSSYVIKQLKEEVQKTVILSEKGERKPATLSCESSILYFSKGNHSKELMEEMKDVHLAYQEDFENFLILDAEEATYFYTQEKLAAEKVAFKRYRLPEGSPIFQGHADHMTLLFRRT